MNFAQKIKQVRVRLDMTQTNFGKEIGVCQNTVSQYEKGGKIPSPKVIKKIVILAKKVKIKITLNDIVSDNFKDAINT